MYLSYALQVTQTKEPMYSGNEARQSVPRRRRRATVSIVLAMIGGAIVSPVLGSSAANATPVANIADINALFATPGAQTAELSGDITSTDNILVPADGSQKTLDLNSFNLTITVPSTPQSVAAIWVPQGADFRLIDGVTDSANNWATLTGSIEGAGIGGIEPQGADPNSYAANGKITIESGMVNATGNNYAAGIGSAQASGSIDGERILITGGTVVATQTRRAAAIGGGGRTNSDIKITGGEVTATKTTGAVGAAIGSGDMGSTKIEISGTASVTASVERSGAAIGCGFVRSSLDCDAEVSIGDSAVVNATKLGTECDDPYPAIGRAFRTNTFGQIPDGDFMFQMTGGVVTATSECGAGVGAFQRLPHHAIDIDVTGGVLRANGAAGQPGIGTSADNDATTITIGDADVTATGGSATATVGAGAGIGGAAGVRGVPVTVGGTSTVVTATGGAADAFRRWCRSGRR